MPSNPRLAEALELIRTQRFKEARAKLTPYVARNPSDNEGRLALAMAQLKTGDPAMAEYACRKLLKEGNLQNTQFADACDILSLTGNLPDAMRLLLDAVQKHPDWANCRVVLANWFNTVNDFHLAISHAQHLCDHHPEFTIEARRVLADAHRSLGNHALALEHYRAVQWANPDDVILAESIAFVSNGVESVGPEQCFQSHIKFARLIENFAADLRFEHPPTDDPERRLRIGFVSHDFNGHSVACFLHGPLANLDRASFEVWGYYTAHTSDAATARLRPLFDRFVDAPRISSVELAKRVHADRIDVLVDLNGITLGHRLHAFQLKPAPVQATWLGYANTTGLRAIDYRIVDATTDPLGTDRFAAEKLLRLDPCFLCYTPLQQRPEIVGPGWTPPAWTPVEHVRFGCFNNVAKVTDAVLDIWSAVLTGTPDATITIKARGLQGPGARETLLKRLAQRNIPVDRIVVLPPTGEVKDHLEHYGAVDIALDTFPYNGTTTTCEALCCGVPVVTYTGDRHAARVSASILRAAGLPELVGQTPEEMVQIARLLAGDRARLQALRTTTAQRFVTSTACDGPAFGARLSTAIRSAWHARCTAGVRR